ncbi:MULTISPECIES: hypothetical protein [Dorea]|nr:MULTISPECIES: hypothetical protein [Dorea]MCB5501168.1 hypothetical protein [Dorea formicigenerans]MCB7080467.1 hypothetical protein [bacterium 210928-DFI.3.100]MDR3790049.1 hypothetical protein [Dorea sp.]
MINEQWYHLDSNDYIPTGWKKISDS